jgi:glycine C-acetyltransferase
MPSTIAQPFDARTDETLRTLRSGGQYKHLQTLLSPMDATVRMRTPEGRETEALCFCSNNYLGLANHPEVVEAGIEGLESTAPAPPASASSAARSSPTSGSRRPSPSTWAPRAATPSSAAGTPPRPSSPPSASRRHHYLRRTQPRLHHRLQSASPPSSRRACSRPSTATATSTTSNGDSKPPRPTRTSPGRSGSSPTASSAWKATSPTSPPCAPSAMSTTPSSSSTIRTATASWATGRGTHEHYGMVDNARLQEPGRQGRLLHRHARQGPRRRRGRLHRRDQRGIELLIQRGRPTLFSNALPVTVAVQRQQGHRDPHARAPARDRSCATTSPTPARRSPRRASKFSNPHRHLPHHRRRHGQGDRDEQDASSNWASSSSASATPWCPRARPPPHPDLRGAHERQHIDTLVDALKKL